MYKYKKQTKITIPNLRGFVPNGLNILQQKDNQTEIQKK